jgi:hypothetical protein
MTKTHELIWIFKSEYNNSVRIIYLVRFNRTKLIDIHPTPLIILLG